MPSPEPQDLIENVNALKGNDQSLIHAALVSISNSLSTHQDIVNYIDALIFYRLCALLINPQFSSAIQLECLKTLTAFSACDTDCIKSLVDVNFCCIVNITTCDFTVSR